MARCRDNRRLAHGGVADGGVADGKGALLSVTRDCAPPGLSGSATPAVGRASPTMRSSMSARAELSERQREILSRVVEEYVATGRRSGRSARRAEPDSTSRRRPCARSSPSSSGSGCSRTPHLGRARADRGRLPRLRRRAARAAGAEARPSSRSSSATHARGGRGGAAGDDRDAVPGDAAARARLGAAARGGDGPARRRAAAAAERRRGRRDHVDRRGDEAALHVPRAGRSGARRPGPATTSASG